MQIKIIFLLVFLVGCKNFPLIESKRGSKTSSTSSPGATSKTPDDDYEDTSSPSEEPQPETPWVGPAPTTPPPASPKIGVIVGPGFLRSFLAVGILQEFHKARIPIHAMVGFEWGSLPAALYATNGQANEVEWQMLKINESSVLKKSLIRNQIEAQSSTELHSFLSMAFDRRSFEQNKIPFECLTFDFRKKQYFWMKKGELSAALSYCLASPPFLTPYLNNVGATDLKLAADTLRQRGANYIVFINPLSTNETFSDSFSPEARVLWGLRQYQLSRTKGLVDFVVDTSSAPYSILDFKARRDMIRVGQEIGQRAVKKLSTKLKI